MRRIILSAFLIVFSIGVYPAIVGNEICRAYPNQCGSTNNSSGGDFASSDYNLSVADFVKVAAYYFLDSKSNWVSLTREFELRGECDQYYLDKAICSIERSHHTYQMLFYCIKNLSYNQEVIEKLKTFDYETFQETNILNKEIFSRIKKFLKNGDIKGVFHEFVNETYAIMTLLEQYEEAKNLEKIWEISHKFSEFELFGQYLTRVFFSI
jgi:anaerobic ribonucleoside-triphosphate reductase